MASHLCACEFKAPMTVAVAMDNTLLRQLGCSHKHSWIGSLHSKLLAQLLAYELACTLSELEFQMVVPLFDVFPHLDIRIAAHTTARLLPQLLVLRHRPALTVMLPQLLILPHRPVLAAAIGAQAAMCHLSYTT